MFGVVGCNFTELSRIFTSKKAVVIVSRCLGFGVCRWNGAALECRLVDELKNEVNFIPVCPECEIGLGMPRPPIRLVQKPGGPALVQPATGLDLSVKMAAFAENFLLSLDRVDGFLLKCKSPSCGLAGIPVYDSPAAELPISKNGGGFFARAAHKLFPETPKIAEDCPDKETFLKLIH